MTLTTTTHSPQQLMAVWHLHLYADTEGPTFIFTTARRLFTSAFYTEPHNPLQDTPMP
jgi:hypothetical protein